MTRRQDIVKLLTQQEMTTRDLALHFKIDSKTILEDLRQIKLGLKPMKLHMQPSQCKQCQYIYKEREKHKRPSKCPQCKSEKITEPAFRIE